MSMGKIEKIKNGCTLCRIHYRKRIFRWFWVIPINGRKAMVEIKVSPNEALTGVLR